MSRPIGPKKAAALVQLEAMRKLNLPDDEIRMKLIESGLTKAQALELVPKPEEAKTEAKQMQPEAKEANIQGAVHFLETIAQRLKPEFCNRYPDLVSVKNDSLTWARKLKGVL